MNEHIQHWDTVMIHLLHSKSNASVLSERQRVQSTKSERQTLNNMKEFLENYCKFLNKTEKAVSIGKRGDIVRLLCGLSAIGLRNY